MRTLFLALLISFAGHADVLETNETEAVLVNGETLQSESFEKKKGLPGVYRDGIFKIVIDKSRRLTTNFLYRYGDYRFYPVFPHRLSKDKATGLLWVRGYFPGTWELKGQQWTCNYPVRLEADHYNKGQSLDVTTTRAQSLVVPTQVGSCPMVGKFVEQFGFDKD